MSDPTVISWDIDERELGDRSSVFDVVGTSDECRVTFNCEDESAAERLVDALRSSSIVGATAEAINNDGLARLAASATIDKARR